MQFHSRKEVNMIAVSRGNFNIGVTTPDGHDIPGTSWEMQDETAVIIVKVSPVTHFLPYVLMHNPYALDVWVNIEHNYKRESLRSFEYPRDTINTRYTFGIPPILFGKEDLLHVLEVEILVPDDRYRTLLKGVIVKRRVVRCIFTCVVK